jgi:hypothetical protein
MLVTVHAVRPMRRGGRLPESRAGCKTCLGLDICQISRWKWCYRGDIGVGARWADAQAELEQDRKVGLAACAQKSIAAGTSGCGQRAANQRAAVVLRSAQTGSTHRRPTIAASKALCSPSPLPSTPASTAPSPAPSSPCSPARPPAGAPSAPPASRASASPNAAALQRPPQARSSTSPARPRASSLPAETLRALRRRSRWLQRPARASSRCPA